eukprot:CAMPEP_0198242120 /NCGR_PEP_ID=MMETSP1446-20131203/11082_1 /TAXON_ID=1461542 ORGANISM="Unidentified sp, Strain CCMP2111" /NCGR_SAMPLE_ID=MMETSP1446 /ASSEMBLY_ACC=CAM_ASM_001112 /LENGTH=137 /DNA_ID=CAMNT_0043925373 /DNA_START=98 /DNA_END=511 /DNA_ORIENTATION=-
MSPANFAKGTQPHTGSRGMRLRSNTAQNQQNTRTKKHKPAEVAPKPSAISAVSTQMQNLGRVDHYFQGANNPEGNSFLKDLFAYPRSSCIAVHGGGTEGYIVNRAFLAEAEKKQSELLEVVQMLKRENERLRVNKQI